MKTLPFIVALLLVLLLSNCNKDNELTGDSTFKLNDTLDLAIDKSAINKEEQFTIRIDSVLEDSRCPSDVLCIWGGNARVRFILSNEKGDTKFELNSNGSTDLNMDAIIDGYHIRLVSLLPYPVSTKEISNNEYVAELLIKKE